MKILKKLICPRCHRFWATMDCTRWPNVTAACIKIVAGDRKKFKDGESLDCSLCGFEYTNYDVTLAGASPDSTEDLQPGQESKLP